MRLYKEIGDIENIKRLEHKFKSIKNEGAFQSFGFDLPKEEVERLNQLVKDEIDQKEEKDILTNFVFCPMYLPLNSIRENAEDWKKNAILSFMAGDKYIR
ncbi:MAG: hypothetical protein ABI325_00315 [Ginsengibacter sp.]